MRSVVANGLYSVAGIISLHFWGRLSGPFQLAISRFISRIYELPISRFMVKPYCFIKYGDLNYHRNFLPGSGASQYKTFQDFFTREFRTAPILESDSVWPCEGYLCEKGQVKDTPRVRVKGEVRDLRTIFGATEKEIPEDYHFSNVFLQNKNYHHIHAPVSGTVKRIEHIPGELLLLRPWAYRKRPSLPALTNERVNVDIEDSVGRTWYLSIVGGPLVATIKYAASLKLNESLSVGEKLASFELGSTCCMLSPIAPRARQGEHVSVGCVLG